MTSRIIVISLCNTHNIIEYVISENIQQTCIFQLILIILCAREGGGFLVES